NRTSALGSPECVTRLRIGSFAPAHLITRYSHCEGFPRGAVVIMRSGDLWTNDAFCQVNVLMVNVTDSASAGTDREFLDHRVCEQSPAQLRNARRARLTGRLVAV